jgi:hypothetical protein
MKPAREEDIPRATHEGEMELLGVKLRTYRLDDGRTLIHADDFHKLMDVMGLDMTTVHSPEAALRAQADKIAKTLKAVERGDPVAFQNDHDGKVAASRAKPTVTFGIAMDDKIVQVTLSWSRIAETDERFLSDFIIGQMRKQAGET